jgi:hypothetical protein
MNADSSLDFTVHPHGLLADLTRDEVRTSPVAEIFLRGARR